MGKVVGLFWPVICNMTLDLGPILKSKSDSKLRKSHSTTRLLLKHLVLLKHLLLYIRCNGDVLKTLSEKKLPINNLSNTDKRNDHIAMKLDKGLEN